jgi:dual specificity phosphatase 12
MTRIWERLFVGSLQDAERLSRKNLNQIATVISLCEQCVELKAADVRYIHLPFEDDEPVPMRQFNAVMDAMAINIRKGTVLVNCGVGISRAPILTAAYLHLVGYKNIDAAIEEIRQLRPIIEPSQILMNSVKENLR